MRLLADALDLPAGQRAAFELAASRGHAPAESGSGMPDAVAQTVPIGGFVGATPPGPIFGRETELSRLMAAGEDANAGLGRLVTISGEPGVGKTRLAQEATSALRQTGFRVVAGRCYETRQSVAYYPFLEALDQLYSNCPVNIRNAVPTAWPFLAHLLPEQDLVVPLPQGGADDRDRLLRAVNAFIVAISVEGPIAIILDDVQWVDEASLDLVQHLTRNTRNTRVLVVVIHRDSDVERTHPLSKALHDLHRDRLVDHLHVRRLSKDASSELIGTAIGQTRRSVELADLIYETADGNPFFTVEIVQALAQSAVPIEAHAEWDHENAGQIVIPATVRDAISERINHLSANTQTLLVEASVLGQAFSFDEILGASNLVESDLEESIYEAMAAGILFEPERERYSFDHVLTQQTLYASLSSRHRRRIHLAAAMAIESMPQANHRSADLAHHYIEGGDGSRALAYSVLAGDRDEALFAHHEAESHYRIALDLATKNADVVTEAKALEKLGRLVTNAGWFDEARELLERSIRRYEGAEDLDGIARATVQLGAVHRSAGSANEGITLIEALTDRLNRAGRPESTIEPYIVLETLYSLAGRYEDGLVAASRAADLIRPAGDAEALGRAEVGRGAELGALGRTGEALTVLEAAIPLAQAAGDVFNLSRAFDNAADLCTDRGEFRRALSFSEPNLRLQRQSDNPWGIAMALSLNGKACNLIGQWTQAEEYFQETERLVRNLADSAYAPMCLLEIACFRADQGRIGEARSLAEGVAVAAASISDVGRERFAQTILAQLDLQDEHPLSAIDRLLLLFDRHGREGQGATAVLPTLAMAYVEGGNLGRAQSTIAAAIDRARHSDSKRFEAEALLAQGRLLGKLGQGKEAGHVLKAVITMAVSTPYPHLQARALYEQAIMFQRAGERAKASKSFDEALHIFQQLGAVLYMNRIKPRFEKDASGR